MGQLVHENLKYKSCVLKKERWLQCYYYSQNVIKLNIKCDGLNYNLGVINDMHHYCVEASFGFIFGLPTFQECDHGWEIITTYFSLES